MTPALNIHRAETESDLAAIRALWIEYWTLLGFDTDFQGFGEELRSLPGNYASPRGLLLLASIDGIQAGCIALRPLSETACEAKRLYVRPCFRGRNIGRTLMDTIIAGARSMRYEALHGDTLSSMSQALELYTALGFERVEPYSPNLTPDAIYLRLSLR